MKTSYKKILAKEKRYLTFSLIGEKYGIDVSYIKEIIGIQKIFAIPNAPVYTRGFINLRNSNITVIDLAQKLGFGTTQIQEYSTIIVTRVDQKEIGFIVDAVEEVAQSIPMDNKEIEQEYIENIVKIKDCVTTILNPKTIIQKDTFIQALQP